MFHVWARIRIDNGIELWGKVKEKKMCANVLNLCGYNPTSEQQQINIWNSNLHWMDTYVKTFKILWFSTHFRFVVRFVLYHFTFFLDFKCKKYTSKPNIFKQNLKKNKISKITHIINGCEYLKIFYYTG